MRRSIAALSGRYGSSHVTTQYDQTALIHAYIQANQAHYLHEDFKTYSVGLLNALQHAFGITITFDGVLDQEARALWMLFHATTQSLLSIRSPRSNFLDDSLINMRLERLGERGKRITNIEATIHHANTLSKTAHLQLLDALFSLLWGSTDTIVTSDDLRQLGFDDTKEPQFRDYIDYL
jgi:hypothetical protein